jgi:hypothetical protein
MMHLSSTPCPSTPAQPRSVLSNLVRLLQHSSALTASIVTRLESFEGRFASRLTGPVSRLHDLDRRRGAVSARPATDLILPGQAVLVWWMTDQSAPQGSPGMCRAQGSASAEKMGNAPNSGSNSLVRAPHRMRKGGEELGGPGWHLASEQRRLVHSKHNWKHDDKAASCDGLDGL